MAPRDVRQCPGGRHWTGASRHTARAHRGSGPAALGAGPLATWAVANWLVLRGQGAAAWGSRPLLPLKPASPYLRPLRESWTWLTAACTRWTRVVQQRQFRPACYFLTRR